MAQHPKILIDDRRQVSADPLGEILSGRFRPSGGAGTSHCPILNLSIEPSLEGREHDLLQTLDFPKSLTIVSDPNCADVLASRVAAAVPSARLEVLKAPKADEITVEELADRTRHAEALIAVGSGTLNDLVKYVSHRRRHPYAVFATAPSMNGYVTATASISRGGEKLSLPATPPNGAFFDLGVLAAAPRHLVQAGVGDCLCRTTVEMDWLLSHYVLGTSFCDMPFVIQRNDEAALLGRVEKLEDADLDAVHALVRLLVLGGLGMLIIGNSQPGSQSEHLISHYIDMLHQPHPGSLHGEQVGLATRAMAHLQEQLLMQDAPPALAEASVQPAALKARFGAKAATFEASLKAKAISRDRLDDMNARMAECWPLLRKSYEARALPYAELTSALDRAGVASDPRALGIDPSFYQQAVLHARELRDRFTILDLAAHSDRLEAFVEQYLFNSYPAKGDRPSAG